MASDLKSSEGEGSARLGVAWAVLGTMVLPWSSFFRFYSIVLLLKVRQLVGAIASLKVSSVPLRDDALNGAVYALPRSDAKADTVNEATMTSC